MRIDAAENRRLILNTAADLFVAHRSAVSMRMVANTAGVGMGTLYRNFKTREDLAEAVAVDLFDNLKKLSESYTQFEETQTWQRYIDGIIAQRIGLLATAFDELFPEGTPRSLDLKRQEALEAVATALTQAKAAGQVREDAQPAEFILAVSLLGLLPRGGDSIGRSKADSWVKDVFLQGLRPTR